MGVGIRDCVEVKLPEGEGPDRVDEVEIVEVDWFDLVPVLAIDDDPEGELDAVLLLVTVGLGTVGLGVVIVRVAPSAESTT